MKKKGFLLRLKLTYYFSKEHTLSTQVVIFSPPTLRWSPTLTRCPRLWKQSPRGSLPNRLMWSGFYWSLSQFFLQWPKTSWSIVFGQLFHFSMMITHQCDDALCFHPLSSARSLRRRSVWCHPRQVQPGEISFSCFFSSIILMLIYICSARWFLATYFHARFHALFSKVNS